MTGSVEINPIKADFSSETDKKTMFTDQSTRGTISDDATEPIHFSSEPDQKTTFSDSLPRGTISEDSMVLDSRSWPSTANERRVLAGMARKLFITLCLKKRERRRTRTTGLPDWTADTTAHCPRPPPIFIFLRTLVRCRSMSPPWTKWNRTGRYIMGPNRQK